MNHDANRTRRQLFSSVLGVAGAFAVARVAGERVVGRGGRLSASGLTVDEPAAVDSPAVRLGVPDPALVKPSGGKIAFPIDPEPECFILDNYGDCRGSRMHIGIDIMASKGQTVFAVADGQLTQVYLDTGAAGYGWTLQDADGTRYRYFHLDAFEPGLKIGSRVSFGQVLGTVGSTGTNSDDNNHLHFEVHRNGTAVNPLPLLVVPEGVRVGPPLKGCL
jgi:murein DD-endopeptidase MepM/ murein hydrolase activator NlpD